MAAIDENTAGYPREIRSSRTHDAAGREGSLVRVFLCGGTAEAVRQRKGLNSTLPTIGSALPGAQIDATPFTEYPTEERLRVASESIRQIGDEQQLCEASFRYTTAAPADPWKPEIEIEAVAETVYLKWGRDGTLLDPDNVSGVPVEVPSEEITYFVQTDTWLGTGGVHDAQPYKYIDASDYIGYTNDDEWLYWPPGTVVYYGVNPVRRIGELFWQVSYHFRTFIPLFTSEDTMVYQPARGKNYYRHKVDPQGESLIGPPEGIQIRRDTSFNTLWPIAGTAYEDLVVAAP